MGTTNAIISVSDKTGLIDFARFLAENGVTLHSTGGTAQALLEAGIDVVKIAEVTGFPEIMDGRVKTLHPRIFGGLLARRDNPQHLSEAAAHAIPLFDFVIVNLYPFADTIRKKSATLADAIENIDIGGVSLIRAAAKNHTAVAVVTRPEHYALVQRDMEQHGGTVSPELRRLLAVHAFAETATYDAQIQRYFAGQFSEAETLPEHLILPLEKVRDLRYGENPHQRAALYYQRTTRDTGVANARQLQGKELSYNNLMDADAAFHIAAAFGRPAAAIIKHANPCGVACAGKLFDAYKLALATDPISAFGGIVAVNTLVDEATAREMANIFTEVIIAPEFSREAVEIFAQKKNLRLLSLGSNHHRESDDLEVRPISGGILLQDRDLKPDNEAGFEVVSKRTPSEDEWRAMLFGWKVVRWVKSNAVIYVKEERTLGIGAGQMSRVDASQLAIDKAAAAGLDLAGSVVASDAFFPFADGVEAAARAGATAVIQPGGSVRDAEVIEAANAHNMAMVFTRIRHFRH